MEPLRVILNPAAKGGKGARLRGAVEAGLQARGIPFHLTPTEAVGHARELASKASLQGAARLLVVGGDGTIHEVANGLLEVDSAPPTLAVVPVGTGNDFFRMIGCPQGLEPALDLLRTGTEKLLDVGVVRFGTQEAHFVNLLGIGLDVEVLRRRGRFARLPGILQYMAALLAALASFRSFPVRISLEGQREISGPTILAGLTLGPSIGGGFQISPEATPFDGFFDFFFVEPLGPGKILRYIPKVLRGTHGEVSEFHARRAREVRMCRADQKPFLFELDGELMPVPVTALDVTICPAVLPVLVQGRSE